MFMVLCSRQVIARVHLVHLMNAEQRQVAAGPQTKPTDLGYNYKSACRLLSPTSTIAILLLSPKADTHFTTHRGQKAEST